MGSRSIGLARNKVTLCQAMETMLVKEKNQGKFDETMCLDYKVEDVKGRENRKHLLKSLPQLYNGGWIIYRQESNI